MTDLTDANEYVKEVISHTEAFEILSRMCNSHFNNPGEHMRASIPANPRRDDDLRLHAYIKQQETKDAGKCGGITDG